MSQYPDLFEELVEQADSRMRTPELHAMWLIKTALDATPLSQVLSGKDITLTFIP